MEHDTVHVTPLFAESLATVAMNDWVPLARTVADVGETLTVMGTGGTLAEPLPHPNSLTARTTQNQTCRSATQFFAFMGHLNFFGESVASP